MVTMISKTYKYCGILFLSGLISMFSLTSCDPEVVAHTDKVDIYIDIQQISAGFAQVKFSTNKPAFYLIGISPVRENINPSDVAKHFMTMALDSAYVDYLYWRNHQLQQLTPFITDFSSYALQYGTVDRYFTFLEPDKDYWVYAFVVDHTTNKPNGKLYYETIHTSATSTYPIAFHYRVEGIWDYIYPIGPDDEVFSHIPWVGASEDSLVIREKGYNTPGEYFFQRFQSVRNEPSKRVYYGIALKENDGNREHDSNIKFEVGKTYYTAMATLDAPMVYPLPEESYDIYRFTWQGDSTKLYFTPEQSTNGEW